MPHLPIAKASLKQCASFLLRTAHGVGFSVFLVASSTNISFAQLGQIKVDWNDPEIVAFVERARKEPTAVRRQLFDPKLGQLKLPVLGFDNTPSSIRNSFSVAPSVKRKLTMDADNPVWYEIAYDYGNDVKITVEADLRVQMTLPPDAKLSEGSGKSGTVDDISTSDTKLKIGSIGSIAEYKVYKFGGIPYSITLECSSKMKSLCRNIPALKRDRQMLRIIAAHPPTQ